MCSAGDPEKPWYVASEVLWDMVQHIDSALGPTEYSAQVTKLGAYNSPALFFFFCATRRQEDCFGLKDQSDPSWMMVKRAVTCSPTSALELASRETSCSTQKAAMQHLTRIAGRTSLISPNFRFFSYIYFPNKCTTSPT